MQDGINVFRKLDFCPTYLLYNDSIRHHACMQEAFLNVHHQIMVSNMHQDFWTIHKDFRYTSLKLMSDNAPLLNDGHKIHKYIEYSKHT